MITQRIDALDIDRRGLFTAIYGINQEPEVYVTSDLMSHSLWEVLYLYLRQQGYLTVFYDDKAFSYEEDQLVEFFDFTVDSDKKGNQPVSNTVQSSAPSGGRRDFFKNKGPMSLTRCVLPPPSTSSPSGMSSQNHQSHHDAIHLANTGLQHIYAVPQSEGFFGSVYNMVEKNVSKKVAIVFVNPNTLEYDDTEQKVYENYLSVLQTKYTQSHIGLKLIALYNFDSAKAFTQALEEGSNKFLMRSPFKELIQAEIAPELKAEGSYSDHENNTVFFLAAPEKDEIANMLNRRRLLGDLPHVFSRVPWQHIVLRLWQGATIKETDSHGKVTQRVLKMMKDFDSNHLSDKQLDQIIENMDTVKAIDRLNSMQGIDNVKQQFAHYREALRAHRLGEGGGRFRPHMALMGSPGTGKTTVARLFGDILREDGLLSKGHFVKADVSDMIGEYVGSTRPKTRALCERAKGGVLFIDEAYGLIAGSNDHGDVDYGTEAIEVLIQFMEDSEDSLVILAGYTDEINQLLNKGNTGFRRRFNELGFFYFQDYKPNVLFDIALKMMPYPMTEVFKKALLGILQFKYAYRNKKFGNVGEVENIVNLIVGNYRKMGIGEPMDVKHLPDRLRILVDSSMMDEEYMLRELNELIGQSNVKNMVRSLYLKARADRRLLQATPDYKVEQPSLNFVFSGNPGTGKTTIARIMGDLLQNMGILSSTDRSVLCELTANELLQMSSSRIKELFENSIGKVLFIDEAYQLRNSQRALADLVGNMTNEDFKNRMCIILAGYQDDMNEMLAVNQGSLSRFTIVDFEDYTNEELWQILLSKVSKPYTQIVMDANACHEPAIRYFASLPREKSFGNARMVDRLVDILKYKRAERLDKKTQEQLGDRNFALAILPGDFPQVDNNVKI